jgi:hypothetical protein
LISKSFESFSPEISDSIETLVIGDSHTQTALNPALMRGCISMSYSDENYFFTYYKLKWALEKEKNIKNVILGFSYHNLSINQENAIKERTFFLEHEFLLLDDYGKLIVKKKSNDLFTYFNMKYVYGLPLNFYNNDHLMINFASDKNEYRVKIWGGYKNMTTANINSEQKSKMIEEKNSRNYEVSDLMVEYLRKIIILCEERNVSLYLVNTPIHQLYYERYSEKTVKRFSSTADSLKTDGRIKYLDFQWFLTADSFYYDGEHLNEAGAEIFSKEMQFILDSEEKNAF